MLPYTSFDIISNSIGRRWFHWPYEKKIFRRQTKTDEFEFTVPLGCC